MFAPYPDWLLEAGCAYWRDAGFDLVAVKSLTQSMTDTRGIYDLHSAELHPLLSSWETSNAQAVLLSGTGMPSLSLMAKPSLVLPHLSSNLCLAWAMQCAAQSLDAQGKRDALLHMISPQAAWRKEWP